MTGHFTSYKTRPNHELATLDPLDLTEGVSWHTVRLLPRVLRNGKR
jgi:hypothetical protein